MNKVYKVIWSKVRNCYVVVSELAKRNGKNTGTIDKRRKLTAGIAMFAMALTLNLGSVGVTEAAGSIFVTDSPTTATAPGDNALAGGNGAKASGISSVAIGTNAKTGKLSEGEAQSTSSFFVV